MAMTAPVPSFDTLPYARRLKEAGVDEAQAETHAEAIRDAITEGATMARGYARREPGVSAHCPLGRARTFDSAARGPASERCLPSPGPAGC